MFKWFLIIYIINTDITATVSGSAFDPGTRYPTSIACTADATNHYPDFDWAWIQAECYLSFDRASDEKFVANRFEEIREEMLKELAK